jgi:hypothetical protein
VTEAAIQRRPAWVIAQDLANAYDPDTGEVLTDQWDALCLELADKAEAIHAVILQHEADAGACKAECDRLRERERRLYAQVDRLKAYLVGCMGAAGVEKLRTPTLTAGIYAGRERVEVDADKLPAHWMRTTTTSAPDKVELLKLLKTGATIEGAQLVRGEDSIRFK